MNSQPNCVAKRLQDGAAGLHRPHFVDMADGAAQLQLHAFAVGEGWVDHVRPVVAAEMISRVAGCNLGELEGPAAGQIAGEGRPAAAGRRRRRRPGSGANRAPTPTPPLPAPVPVQPAASPAPCWSGRRSAPSSRRWLCAARAGSGHPPTRRPTARIRDRRPAAPACTAAPATGQRLLRLGRPGRRQTSRSAGRRPRFPSCGWGSAVRIPVRAARGRSWRPARKIRAAAS